MTPARISLGRLLVATALISIGLSPQPAHAAWRVFVANAGDRTVSVLNGDDDREEAVIPVGNFPQGLALRTQPTPLLAVANSRASSVTFVDPLTLTTLGDEIPVGRFPIDMAFSADGQLLFCSSDDDQSIVVLDVQTRTPVGSPISIGGVPRRLTLSPDGNSLFVAKYVEDGAVLVVDVRTRAITATIPVGPFPTGLALQPDGKRLFAASFNASTVTAIDLSTLKPIETFEMSTGYGLLIHPTRPLLYSIVSMDDEVQVVDYATKAEVARVPVGQKPTYSAISPDGRFVYVVNGTDGNVMKLDTATNQVLLRIAVGVEPSAAVVFTMPRRVPHRVVYGGVAVGLLVLTGALVAWRRRARAT